MFLMKGCVMASDPRETIMDDILGHALEEKNQYVTNVFITTCDCLQLNFCLQRVVCIELCV